ncbi:MAG TPA: ParA family protein [Burkholderiaceae bacterium]|nr:ParA family protein [Burkholderiaceae bacterium]
MPVVLIANPKGGVGKSTLATNTAGYFARLGHRVMLGDTDRQQSSRAWLALRAESLPRIEAWEVGEDRTLRPPKGTTHVVLDTPAGLHGEPLVTLLKIAHRVLVPLQPSMFDILATRDFLAELVESKPVRDGRTEVAIVGMRVDARTRAAEQLQRYVETLNLPVLTMLRDTQNYVQLAAHGLTVFDVAPSRVEKDLEQWTPIRAWLDRP